MERARARLHACLIAAFISPILLAHKAEASDSSAPQSLPEEVQVTADRSFLNMRLDLWAAEVKAYEVFNSFNDDKRFHITCSLRSPTGTRVQRQVCSTGFERAATRDHAQAYFLNYRDFLDPYTVPGTSQVARQSQEAEIASQQKEYKDKLKQVALEHPEFLEAIVHYSDIRVRYEAAAQFRGSE